MNDQTGRRLALRAITLLAIAGGVFACESSNPSSDVTRDPADVQALALDSSAPLLLADSVSFYAVKGQNRSVELRFADSLGQPGVALVRLEVDRDGLDKAPDGRRYQSGDSVLITIRAIDPQSLAFDFQPSGLVFRHDKALLTVAYGNALPTAGLVQDEGDLALWVQERDNDTYRRIETSVDISHKQVKGKIPGFSKYAVAY